MLLRAASMQLACSGRNQYPRIDRVRGRQATERVSSSLGKADTWEVRGNTENPRKR